MICMSNGSQYLPKMRVFFLLSHNQWMIFSWKSQVSSIFIVIPHFSDSKYFWQQAADRTGYGSNATGSAEGLKFALIKLPVRNNNSDLRFNSISIFHITGFSAGILLSSEHFIFFLKYFLICFDFLISQLRQITDHRRAGESYAYALRRVIVSCFLIQLISIVGCGKPKGEFQKSEKMKIILEI